MSIELVMPSNHLILCQRLLFLPLIFPSISVFSNELALHIRWPKYWSFSFSISPPNEYSVLISFRTGLIFLYLNFIKFMVKKVNSHTQVIPKIFKCFPIIGLSVWCLVAKSFLTLLWPPAPLDYSPPGSSVHGILQARILDWVAISSSMNYILYL